MDSAAYRRASRQSGEYTGNTFASFGISWIFVSRCGTQELIRLNARSLASFSHSAYRISRWQSKFPSDTSYFLAIDIPTSRPTRPRDDGKQFRISPRSRKNSRYFHIIEARGSRPFAGQHPVEFSRRAAAISSRFGIFCFYARDTTLVKIHVREIAVELEWKRRKRGGSGWENATISFNDRRISRCSASPA